MTLAELRNIDVREIDPDMLVHIADVTVDMDLPKTDRMFDVAKQMNGIPNFFISESGIIVKISFADTTRSVDNCVEDWMRMQ
jgi:hypothetical protein